MEVCGHPPSVQLVPHKEMWKTSTKKERLESGKLWISAPAAASSNNSKIQIIFDTKGNVTLVNDITIFRYIIETVFKAKY